MNWNMKGIKKEWENVCRAVDRPVVRKKMDAKLGIYGDEKASRPVMSIDIDGEWCYKLSCALKVIGAAMVIMWIIHRISKMFRKWM